MRIDWRGLVRKAGKPASAIASRISRRLANKLVLLFSAIIILVVISLTVISYQMLRQQSVQSSIASTSNNLLLVNQNMNDYLAGIEQLSLPQFDYDELTYAILREDKDYASRMYLENYLRSLYYSRDDLEAIYFYVIGRQSYYALTREKYDVTVRTGAGKDISGCGWYAAAMDSPKNSSYQSLYGQPPGDGICTPANLPASFMGYHRVMRSIVTRQPQAIISFYFNPSGKDRILKDVPLREGQHLLLLGLDGSPFHADDADFLRQARDAGLPDKLSPGSGRLTWSEGDRDYLVVYDVSQAEGWKLVKPIPYRELDEAATTNRNISFAIGLGFLLLSVIAVVIFSSAITRPLGRLQEEMSRFSAGDFEANAPVRGRDEIAYVSHYFNLMVKRTNELINERYKMKLVEKNAILKALEAEINPHFLYNALQAISTKAIKRGNDDLADMVDALALTFRYCISGKDIVLAREELQHIGRYMSLQKARFGSRLQIDYDWDEALMELEIPKLSIQTLAENAIKHGVERVTRPVTITIAASLTNEHAVISVTDDGPGFEEGRLERVLHSFEGDWKDSEGEQVGLVNLHTRLRLLYGEKARLVIHTDKTGTRMEMLLPRGGSEQRV